MNLNLDEIVVRIDVPELQASLGFDVGFDIDPGVAFPRVIEHIQDVLSGKDSIPYDGFSNLMNAARAVTARGWSLARDSENQNTSVMSFNERQERAQALEVARLWLTELLHQSVDHQNMYVHLIKNKAWKL